MRISPENLDGSGFGTLFSKAADTLRAGFSVASLTIEKAAAVKSGTAPASSLAITSEEIRTKSEELKKAQAERLRAEMMKADAERAKAEADKAKAQKIQILIVGGVVAAVLFLSRK